MNNMMIASVSLSAAAVLGMGIIQYQPELASPTPTTPGIDQSVDANEMGRTNVHSGGRKDKRHGGGGRNNPHSCTIGDCAGWQMTGRTNVHSGGRPHNTAQRRHGGGTHNQVTKGVRKLGYTLQVVVPDTGSAQLT